MKASEVIECALLSYGMSQVEIDIILAQFLEEEAFDYVECMIEMSRDDCKVIVH